MMKPVLLILLFLLIGCIQQPVDEPKVESQAPAPIEAPVQPPDGQEQQKSTSLQPRLLWNYTTMDNVYGVALSGNGEYAALGSWDDRVYFLNKKGELLWEFKAKGGVHDVAMTSSADTIAVLSYIYDETTLHVIDKNGRELWNLSLPGLARGVDITEDGSIAVASYTGKVILLKEGSILWEYALEKSAWGAWDAVFADNRIIAGDDNAIIYELDLKGELLRKKKLGRKDYIYGVAADPEGSYVAAVTQDKNVYLFRDGKLQWKHQTGFSNYGAAISPRGDLVAVGSWDKNLYLYDIQGKLLWKHYVGDSVNRISFSGDGRYLLIGSSDNSAYLFELG
jgi:WD40 repeat protein